MNEVVNSITQISLTYMKYCFFGVMGLFALILIIIILGLIAGIIWDKCG